MSLEISFTVIAVAFLVLVALAVPFLVQARRTARNMAVTLETLNQGLPGILKNLEEITANVNKAAYMVNRQVDDLALAIGRVRQVLDCLRPETGRVFSTLRTITAAVKGAGVFFEAFRSRR